MHWIFIFFFIVLQQFLYCQSGKFSKSLIDYTVQLPIDSIDFKRISYSEMHGLYAKQGIDFDNFLKEKQLESLMIYYPAATPLDQIIDQLSITVTVRKQNDDDLISSKKMDTLTTFGKHFLLSMQTNTIDRHEFYVYFDTLTHSMISKNLYKLIDRVPSGKNKMVPYVENKRKVFSILQSFQKDGFIFEIEYRCYDDLTEKYFPVFEKILSTLKWESK